MTASPSPTASVRPSTPEPFTTTDLQVALYLKGHGIEADYGASNPITYGYKGEKTARIQELLKARG